MAAAALEGKLSIFSQALKRRHLLRSVTTDAVERGYAADDAAEVCAEDGGEEGCAALGQRGCAADDEGEVSGGDDGEEDCFAPGRHSEKTVGRMRFPQPRS